VRIFNKFDLGVLTRCPLYLFGPKKAKKDATPIVNAGFGGISLVSFENNLPLVFENLKKLRKKFGNINTIHLYLYCTNILVQ
jgi:hypothetical protein